MPNSPPLPCHAANAAEAVIDHLLASASSPSAVLGYYTRETSLRALRLACRDARAAVDARICSLRAEGQLAALPAAAARLSGLRELRITWGDDKESKPAALAGALRTLASTTPALSSVAVHHHYTNPRTAAVELAGALPALAALTHADLGFCTNRRGARLLVKALAGLEHLQSLRLWLYVPLTQPTDPDMPHDQYADGFVQAPPVVSVSWPRLQVIQEHRRKRLSCWPIALRTWSLHLSCSAGSPRSWPLVDMCGTNACATAAPLCATPHARRSWRSIRTPSRCCRSWQGRCSRRCARSASPWAGPSVKRCRASFRGYRTCGRRGGPHSWSAWS